MTHEFFIVDLYKKPPLHHITRTWGGTRTRVAGVQHGSSSGGMDGGCPVGGATARCGGEGACPPTGPQRFGSQPERGYTAISQTRPTRLQACWVRVRSQDGHAQRRVQRRRVTPSLARQGTPQARPASVLPMTLVGRTAAGGGLALARAGHDIAATHGDARVPVSQKHTDRRDVCTGLSRFSTPAMPPRSPPCGPVCRTSLASRAWTSHRFRMCPTMWPNSMRWL